MKVHLIYLRVGFIITLGGLSLVFLINLAVDPYSLFQVFKEKEFEHDLSLTAPWRLEAAYRTRRRSPEVIILGSSRAISGLSIKDPAWNNSGEMVPLNIALPGVNMTEIRAYFEHAHAIKPLKHVVIGLDFFSFNAFRQEIVDFDKRRLATEAVSTQLFAFIRDMTSTLISLDALQASVNSLMKSKMEHEGSIHTSKPYRKIFQTMERAYMRGLWFPCPATNFALDPTDGQVNQFDQLQAIISTARRDGIKLEIFISPIHARLLETMFQVGLWDEYERWKRKLLNLVNLENIAVKQGPELQLWDFSEYNKYTIEDVPEMGDKNANMQWFLDSAHYTVKFGHMVLTDLLGNNHLSKYGIGRILRADNIEQHLKRLRRERLNYALSHPEDVAEIEKQVKETEGYRAQTHCRL